MSKLNANTTTITETPKAQIINPITFTVPTSLRVRAVSLHDWWLLKPSVGGNGKGLAIGGFSSRERAGIRVFSSAAVSNRHETTILETIDGMIITITGFINGSRTSQNGFPPEVCNRFRLGFPFDWEKYATSCGEEFSGTIVHDSNTTNSNTPLDFDDLPLTRVRDLLISGVSNHPYIMKCLHTGSNSPAKNAEPGLTETPNNYKVRESRSKAGKNFLSTSRGVCTRSMTRLSRCEEKNVSSAGRRSSMRLKDVRK